MLFSLFFMFSNLYLLDLHNKKLLHYHIDATSTKLKLKTMSALMKCGYKKFAFFLFLTSMLRSCVVFRDVGNIWFIFHVLQLVPPREHSIIVLH